MRRTVRDVVSAITPGGPVESATRRSVLDWIDSPAPLFRVAGASKHLAVYFALVDGDSLLQIDHVKAGTWLLPGGHVDTEPPWDAVVREAQEELGIIAAPHPATGPQPIYLTESVTLGPGAHTDVTLWFVLAGDRTAALTPDPAEIRRTRWVRLGDVATWSADGYAPEQVRAFAAKLGAALG
ncbi:NUDIX domain-containing protein [Micromonosporaceae bacterium Da 78-11]